jgi:arsenate reductase
MFSDTFAGIAPASVAPFIAAQIAGGALALGIIKVLYPGITPAQAADAVMPRLRADALPGPGGDAAPEPRDHRAGNGAAPARDPHR